MSELVRNVLPWILVPGVLFILPFAALRARWGSRNPRFVKVLVSAALMMTLTVPVIGGILDDWLRLVGVHVLVCDSIAIYMSRQAALGIWEQTSTSSGSTRSKAILDAGLTTLSVGGVATLLISYVSAYQSGLDLMRLDASSLQPGPLTFWIAFCGAHGTNMAIALGRAVQARWGRVVPVNQRDRASLTWWVVSCAAIWVYILNFPIALALIATGRADHFVVVNTQLLQALAGLVGCIAGGICAATWADVEIRLQHLLLHPTWNWCTKTEQDVVLYPLMNGPGERLSRRRTELALAADRLLATTTPDERAAVAEAVRAGTVRPHEHWGLLLHAGRRGRLKGRPSQAMSPSEPLPKGPDSLWFLQLVVWRRRRYERLHTKTLLPLLS
ncbi:hypothetical protein [Kineococcus sp. R86509]|uniref:hypothetical protein n=1 Tax=Kineococcus sp. R86509 TaxID=3093851 RepID=UPI0036D3687E